MGKPKFSPANYFGSAFATVSATRLRPVSSLLRQKRLIMFYMAAEDDAEWKLILALEILAAELRRQGMSKNQVREILNLRFQQGDPHLGLATTRR